MDVFHLTKREKNGGGGGLPTALPPPPPTYFFSSLPYMLLKVIANPRIFPWGALKATNIDNI